MLASAKQIVWKKEDNEWLIYKNIENKKKIVQKQDKDKDKKQDGQLVKNFPQTQKRQKGNIIYCAQGYGTLQDIDLATKKVVVKANNEMLNYMLHEINFEIPINIKALKEQQVQKEVTFQIPLYSSSEDLLNKIAECLGDELDEEAATNMQVQAFFNGKMILPTKQSLQTIGILPNSKILVLGEACALDSVILKNAKDIKLLKSFFNTSKIKFELLFRASRDGFTGAAFHQICDNHERTLVIAQEATTLAICGGYANLPWSISYQYKEDKDGFVYSLKTGKKYTIYRNNQYAYYHDPNYGPTFGGGHDLYIAGTGQSCYTNLGYCYGSEEEGVKYSSEQARTELIGIYQFNLKDYEVFKVT